MTIEIRVPTLGESVAEATVGKWLKKQGDVVKADEPLVELETDKVTVEVPAPAAGLLSEILVSEGATVAIGAVLGALAEGGGAQAQAKTAAPQPAAPKAEAPAAAPARGAPPSPAARKHLAEAGLSSDDVAGSGRRGQVLKEDVVAAVAQAAAARQKPAPQPQREAAAPSPAPAPARVPVPQTPHEISTPDIRVPTAVSEAGREERVRMTRLRQTIAMRLKEAQNTAAMLTTFNDVDMSAVIAMRAQYKDLFEKRHGVKLGFMGFFVKACIQALREIPAVNAEIDGEDIVFKNYYHIGVAVGTDRGLVVPVLREADRMSIAEIEGKIAEFGKRAREGRLSIAEMQGGTFTISNGGVYGSMLSTPILNAPQAGILGMHRIEERPVVKNGQIVARPMMYLALSYDHRLVDGKEAVTFLVRVKECLEDPQRFILEL
ncbi:2-oxoglutarate dehydrogenase complex dihydrolipoyllysine-residue succinyltransferase [Hyphomicrobium sp. DMF-1]|jgi:2-oxoglutarate dehydrogenase E2 component (dihydrolipoamide succinyltransferase)|uniref:2-oxoglutarate dehydrogenase complex dihydrolipoyllysine-residue succinyltransferase n=1 Tax=Hyphomicrobium sp. DMF-1 TaxID=3019544 RepID=UPI0022EBC80C|nr:2-oxoglutarate dehydrogenase complex dihydrolipoyllysine-residue succinyltransferase [Hyphomicrobium sp. DMF-1]WBT38704.1 2-oxoglutarate dehydrogenase complex dihydrolipoyllysine-residue succinyltransferase [Hyphomicrobium sp. DMF-1]